MREAATATDDLVAAAVVGAVGEGKGQLMDGWDSEADAVPYNLPRAVFDAMHAVGGRVEASTVRPNLG
ncbi:hypothetical protein [Streptomyces sp. NPDC058307]|uniref:hypothetical protein n=1 Tax=Streptomyces sp. NPDC058307 TaxID=3346439 RepID=UPI0036EF7D1E